MCGTDERGKKLIEDEQSGRCRKTTFLRERCRQATSRRSPLETTRFPRDESFAVCLEGELGHDFWHLLELDTLSGDVCQHGIVVVSGQTEQIARGSSPVSTRRARFRFHPPPNHVPPLPPTHTHPLALYSSRHHESQDVRKLIDDNLLHIVHRRSEQIRADRSSPIRRTLSPPAGRRCRLQDPFP